MPRRNREPLITESQRAAILKQPSAAATQVIHSSSIGRLTADGFLDIAPRSGQPHRINPRRREDSGSRGSSKEASSSENSSQLPRDAGNSTEKPAVKAIQQPVIPTEESPAIILQGLMDKFIFLKENGGKAEAFKALQRSFAAHAAVLSPYFIPLKDLMNLIMELETFIGRSGEHVGKTPEQVLRGFLATNMIADTVISPTYPNISIDNGG